MIADLKWVYQPAVTIADTLSHADHHNLPSWLAGTG